MTTGRFLSKKEVCSLVLYCPAHIARLEKAKAFPSRTSLGVSRVGYWEPKVRAWMRCKLEGREWTPDTPDEE